jgi:hypothetical protein
MIKYQPPPLISITPMIQHQPSPNTAHMKISSNPRLAFPDSSLTKHQTSNSTSATHESKYSEPDDHPGPRKASPPYRHAIHHRPGLCASKAPATSTRTSTTAANHHHRRIGEAAFGPPAATIRFRSRDRPGRVPTAATFRARASESTSRRNGPRNQGVSAGA